MTDRPYQDRVQDWMLECFGEDIANNKAERAFRFLEEALELAQAMGVTPQEAKDLLNYTFARPVGEPAQEVGGVLVCLATLCTMTGIDMAGAGETELGRVWTKMDKIRAKHAAKPKNVRTSLPGDPAATLADSLG